MTAAARHARAGAVTVAVAAGDDDGRAVRAGRRARRDRGRLRPWSATTCSTVATEVLERLLGGGGELVTVVGGRRTSGDLAAALRVVPPATPTPPSTSWSTTAGRRATRCSSVSSGARGMTTTGRPLASTIGWDAKLATVAGKRRRRSRRPSATAPSATCCSTTRGAGSTRAQLTDLGTHRARRARHRDRAGHERVAAHLPRPAPRRHGLPPRGHRRHRGRPAHADVLRQAAAHRGLARRPAAPRAAPGCSPARSARSAASCS